MASTPTGKKYLVGLILKRMIEERGISFKEAGEPIGYSQSRISELVAGKGRIGVGDLKELSESLGFTDPDHLAFLRMLRTDWEKRAAWSANVDAGVLHQDIQLLADMEWVAVSVRTVGTEIVPGLLQGEEYIRAVYANWSRPGSDVTLDDVVEARRQRQGCLHRPDNPLQFHAVLSESSLRREFGGAEVMHNQLTHLEELSRMPNIVLQVIPFQVQPTAAAIDRFQLLELPSSGVIGPISLARIENPGEIRFIDLKDSLIAYNHAWARLTAVASSPEDTRQFLRHVARGYR